MLIIVNLLFRVLAQPHLTQLHITRGARRTCKAAPWLSKRTVDHKLNEEVLTTESKEFLKNVAIERFKERMANSPLKDAPAERHQWTPK